MRFVVVTGMSGAGKSSVLKMLEDVGYFCIDNLPVPLMPKLKEILLASKEEITKVALGIDIRSSNNFKQISELLGEWESEDIQVEILFMDADDKTLIKRYKETRRSHPLSVETRIDQGIEKERVLLEDIRKKATYVLDTSQLLTRELKAEITRIFVENKEYNNMYLTVLSFGFKNGIPADADLVFDVRFLPNPYYIEQLRQQSGEDQEVREYVMACEAAQEFLVKLIDMTKFLIPQYIAEGKNHLVVAIGCTGGKHRSVTLANELYEALLKQEKCGLRVEHRDIIRENKIKEV